MKKMIRVVSKHSGSSDIAVSCLTTIQLEDHQAWTRCSVVWPCPPCSGERERKQAEPFHVNEDNSDTPPLCVAQPAVVDLREKRLSVTKKSYPL